MGDINTIVNCYVGQVSQPDTTEVSTPGVTAYQFMLEQNVGRTMLQFQVTIYLLYLVLGIVDSVDTVGRVGSVGILGIIVNIMLVVLLVVLLVLKVLIFDHCYRS